MKQNLKIYRAILPICMVLASLSVHEKDYAWATLFALCSIIVGVAVVLSDLKITVEVDTNA